MNTNDKARQLLCGSYGVSAQRITGALQGTLVIQNSREPANPPPSSGEVVGLCGQSGRHPYFRIPVDVLTSAVERITRACMTSSSTDFMMEEIAAACQDLRQQTYFDTGSGCVNDQLPSMVPLLPPEEIWLDGRQLPMDIWRLVSFDFDLVSSSVLSPRPVEDFAFSAVNQNALAFRTLINQLGNRRVTFDVQLERIPAVWGLITTQRTIDVSLARLFFEAGSLLTPLATEDFTKWYGAVRYLHWIDDVASELRVKDDFRRDSIDSRYRGLFAEETAIGLMAIVLADLFNAGPINNTVEVVPRNLIDPGQLIADFVAQAVVPATSQKVTIVAESKGSLGNIVSSGRHKRAKQQLAATKKLLFSGSSQLSAFTFGSTIRFSGQKLRSHCLVVDPPADFEPASIELDPAQAWRIAFAKALKFVGLEMAAQQVARGEPGHAIRPVDFDRRLDRKRSDRDVQRLRRARVAREVLHMDLVLDIGFYALGIDSGVLEILQHGINSNSEGAIRETLSSRRRFLRERVHRLSFESSIGVGCISYLELDNLVRDNM